MCRSEQVDLHEIPGTWCVLHTRARHEKALAWELCRFGVDYFIPLVRRRMLHGRRPAEVTLPLFAGYVFTAFRSPEDRALALGTRRVARVIPVVDQAQMVMELEQVRRAVNAPYPVDLYPRIKRGRRCRVIGGSLRGLEGVVAARRGRWRVFLDVKMLGQSAVVEIDAGLLEPIRGGALMGSPIARGSGRDVAVPRAEMRFGVRAAR